MEAHGVYIKLVLDLEPDAVTEKLTNEHNIHATKVVNKDAFIRSYNISQYDFAPVLRQNASENSGPVLHMMRWGLLPSFKEHEDISYPLMDSFDGCTSAMWAPLFAHKRCIVVCQGFFLWRKKEVQDGKKKKKTLVPYYHRYANDRLILLAAVYDHNKRVPGGNPIDSFSLLVKRSGDNHVTPAVLQAADACARWLDTGAVCWQDAKPLALRAVRADMQALFKRSEVAPDIERAGAAGPALLGPPAERSDGIKAGFERSAQLAVAPPGPARRALKPRSAPSRSAVAPTPPSPPTRKRKNTAPLSAEACGSMPRKKGKVAHVASERLQDMLRATERQRHDGAGEDKAAEGTTNDAANGGERKRAPSPVHREREDASAAGSSAESKERQRTASPAVAADAAVGKGKGKGKERADEHEAEARRQPCINFRLLII